jgi:hypothetical protein
MSQFEQPFEDFQADQHREVDFSDNDPSKKFTKLDEARYPFDTNAKNEQLMNTKEKHHDTC